jgi:UDP-N-acetyl-D-glucosamine dehydrogenase
MPKWVIKRMLANIKEKKPKILILGVAYKKNVDDDRESPSIEIMKLLTKKKVRFEYNDPYFPQLRKGRNFKFTKKSMPITEKNLKKFNAILVVTDHDIYNYKFIYKNSKQVFDARGVYKNLGCEKVIYC